MTVLTEHAGRDNNDHSLEVAPNVQHKMKTTGQIMSRMKKKTKRIFVFNKYGVGKSAVVTVRKLYLSRRTRL